MGKQFGPGTSVGKIVDAVPVSEELKMRMAGLYNQGLTGASQGMPFEERSRYLNLAKEFAKQPVTIRNDEDIENQQQNQKTTGYVS
jgi:hypothetical protein